MRTLLAIMVLLLGFAAPAAADGYVQGSDGYWYLNGQAYTRQSVYCGHQSPTCYCWKYYAVPVAQKASVNVINNLIGVPVPFTYGTPITQQGATSYGASVPAQLGLSAFQDTYGSFDPATLFNQAGRFVSQAQQLAGQAQGDFVAALQQEGANRSDVAKILARGQAAATVLNSTRENTPVVQSRTFSFSVSQGADGRFNVTPSDNGQGPAGNGGGFNTGGVGGQPAGQLGTLSIDGLQPALEKVILTRCASCHSSKEPKSGIDLTKLLSYSAEQMEAVLRYVQPQNDAAHRCPKDAEPLNIQELSVLGAFYQLLGSGR